MVESREFGVQGSFPTASRFLHQPHRLLGLGSTLHGLGLRVYGRKITVQGLGLKVDGAGSRVEGFGSVARVESLGSGSRVEGREFRVQGSFPAASRFLDTGFGVEG